LAESDAASDADLRAALRNPLGVAWAGINPNTENRMQFVALRREAHEVINGRPPEDPWWLLYKARLFARLERDAAAEELFAKAVALRPDDPAVWLARGQVFTQLGRADRAEADFTKATELKGTDPEPFIAAGRAFAERGDHARADRLFTRAAELTPNELNRFLEAGWWVAGSYPPTLDAPCPPESGADPAQPAFAAAGNATHAWRTAVPDANGHVHLRPLFNADNVSAYALAYVYSPGERPATLMVAGSHRVRVWLNGGLVHATTAAQTFAWGAERVPVVLRQGRNTVVVRAAAAAGPYCLNVRLGDNPVDRGLLRFDQGLWAEAADELGLALSRGGLKNDTCVRRKHLTALLAAGRIDEHRAGVARMLAEFGTTTDPTVAANVISACDPVPDSGADFARLAKLVEAERLTNGARPLGTLVLVARGYFRAGQLDKAEDLLKEYLSKIPAPVPHPLPALLVHRRGKTAEARVLLGQAEAWYAAEVARHLAQPTLPWPTTSGFLADYAILLAEARAAVGLQPDKVPGAAALQAPFRQVLTRLDPATADFDQLVMTFSTDPRYRLARGHRLGELGRWQEAEADFAKAVELTPKDHQVWRERGRLRAELKQWDAAAADFAKALELAPLPPPSPRAGFHDPFPWAVGRGGVDDELCRWDEVFERVAKLRPTDWGLWFRRCQHLGKQGRWAEAAAAAAGTIERNPDYYLAWYLRATLFLETGDQAGYRELCRAALHQFRDTTDRRAANLIAFICTMQADAVPDLGPVARLADLSLAGGRENLPMYTWHVANSALVHLRVGEYDRAATKLAASGGSGMFEFAAKFGAVRAIAAAKLGRPAEARQALAEVKAIVERDSPDLARGQRSTGWHDWLHVRLFVREAEALLGPAATQAATAKP
jgi:tetratricopeptide (TPR) repeat protein